MIGEISGDIENCLSIRIGIDNVKRGRRVCSIIAGKRRFGWKYIDDIPPSLARVWLNSVIEEGVELCDGIAINLVRSNSIGERRRWVIRCEATCNPNGRAGWGIAVRGISGLTVLFENDNIDEWILGCRILDNKE